VEHQKQLFRVLVVQDFQKFSKSLNPLCRPFRQPFHFGKQLVDFLLSGRQIETPGWSSTSANVSALPNHRFTADITPFIRRELRRRFWWRSLCFCCFFHIYTRERYLTFSLVGDSEYCSSASCMMSCGSDQKATEESTTNISETADAINQSAK